MARQETKAGPGGTTDTYSVPEGDKWVIAGVEVSKWVYDRHAALQAEVERLRSALIQAEPVVEFVSRGRRYAFVDTDELRYPDATARRVNAQIKEALHGRR